MVTPVLQRTNMVESQIRPSDVTDRRILSAMQEIPRERFVPVELRALAYMDEPLPLASEPSSRRALMAPRVFAKLLQLLELNPSDIVLDIGTASGYSAAVLSKLARKIIALESEKGLAARARETLAELKISNVSVVEGKLANGYPEGAPYHAVVLEGSVQDVPAALLDQIALNGRLATVMQDANGSQAVVWLRTEGAFARRTAFDATSPALPGFQLGASFKF